MKSEPIQADLVLLGCHTKGKQVADSTARAVQSRASKETTTESNPNKALSAARRWSSATIV
jgi:hypothetical protein